MRRFLIRSGVALVVLPLLWYFTSRWCALLVDQAYTPHLAGIEAAPIGWNGTWLQIGIGLFDKAVPNGYRADVSGLGPDYKSGRAFHRRRPARFREGRGALCARPARRSGRH